MKLQLLSLLAFAACPVILGNISPENTVVTIINNSSKSVELRIKSLFVDTHGASTKGGGVRITVAPHSKGSVDLRASVQRFRDESKESKGAIKEELSTLRKIDAAHLASIKVLKIAAIDASNEKKLFTIFTEQPKKKKGDKVVVEKFAQADTLVLKDIDSGVSLDVE
jgi:hypothetical protein